MREDKRLGPFEAMTDEQRSEWIDTIANQGSGEISAFTQLEGLEQSHINELMLDNSYDR